MKKKLLFLFRAALLFSLFLLLLSGCGKAESDEPHSSTVFAMDTVMNFTVYGPETLLTDAENLILTLEHKLSTTDEAGEIYALNQNGGGRISEDTAELLSRALALCAGTNGKLDISIYPIVRAWGFTTGQYNIPSADEIAELLDRVDYTAVQIEEDGAVTLGAGMEIDLGSVAKGYAGSRIVELFRSSGVESALLNLGGNVQAMGAKPDGSPWRIAIKDPVSTEYAGVVEIVDRAVVTSGGYERFFEKDGVVYRHIMDPITGYPVDNDLLSVTVIGKDGLVCDALSTALFVMGLDQAIEFWKSSDNFEAVFIDSDKNIYITSGLEQSFSPLGNYKERKPAVIYRTE